MATQKIKDSTSLSLKAVSVVGIDFDNYSIRAVRMHHGGATGYKIDSLCEEKGNFSDEGELLEGLRAVRARLSIGQKDQIVTALTGKQVWAGELQFKNLPPEELGSALKLEVRKSLHFEASGSTIDWQMLAAPTENNELATLLVVAAHNNLIQRQIVLLERAGMRTSIVEVLPIAVTNALWAQMGNGKGEAAHVALHFGPQVCTVVIDGEKSPFFNRSIYFTAEEVYGTARQLSDRDRDKRLNLLSEEIARSLAYYEKNAMVQGYSGIMLLGDYATEPGLDLLVKRATGILPKPPDLITRFGYHAPANPCSYAVALALALRGDA